MKISSLHKLTDIRLERQYRIQHLQISARPKRYRRMDTAAFYVAPQLEAGVLVRKLSQLTPLS
jgi:hypothetical protein